MAFSVLLLAPIWFCASRPSLAATLDEGLRTYAAHDYRAALTALTPWAEGGEPQAQLTLGRMYAAGYGVVQDYMQAHTWLNLAASTGSAQARAEREAVAARMTPSQIAQAQAAARAWKPTRRPSTSQVASTSSRAPPTGNLVARVQAMLAELGYDPGSADGVAGERTREAIRSYQSHSGLPMSGEASLSLHDALAADLGIATPAPSATVSPPVAPAQDSVVGNSAPSRPSQPRRSTQRLARAMSALVGVIDDAERRRAADHDVVDRLRRLVARYTPKDSSGHSATALPAPNARGPIPNSTSALRSTRIAFDSFNDGDFTSNPRWTVRQGQFWVDEKYRLRTEVALASAPKETAKEDIPLAILGAILGRQRGTKTAPDDRAVIDLDVDVPATFEMRMSFFVGNPPGTLEFSLLSAKGVQFHQTLRITFTDASMRLALITGGGRTLDEASLRTNPRKGAVREVTWRHDADGRAVVTVEGKKLLRPRARAGDGSFSTLRIANVSGRFGIDFIELSDVGRRRY